MGGGHRGSSHNNTPLATATCVSADVVSKAFKKDIKSLTPEDKGCKHQKNPVLFNSYYIKNRVVTPNSLKIRKSAKLRGVLIDFLFFSCGDAVVNVRHS